MDEHRTVNQYLENFDEEPWKNREEKRKMQRKRRNCDENAEKEKEEKEEEASM